MAKRVIIIGCNGLLGQKLVAQFHQNYDVVGCSVEPQLLFQTDISYQQLDITKREQVKRFIMNQKPHLVINVAAYTNVDGAEEEKQLCWSINVSGVENLSYYTHLANAKLVHISTDYIFDGHKGNYVESDRPNPLGYYAKSKLAGENAVIASGVDYIIARTAVLYGKAENVRPNFVTWLISQLQQQKQVTIVDDQIGNPTLVDNLAEAVATAVELGGEGVYHLAGREAINRFDFALKIAEIFELNAGLIQKGKTDALKQSAPRPLNASLNVSKALTELGVNLYNVEEGLRVLKHQIWRCDAL